MAEKMQQELITPEGCKLDADKALIALGPLGRYQMRVFFLGNFVWLFIGLQLMGSAFLASEPPFNCYEKNQPIQNYSTFESQCFLNRTGDSALTCGSNGTIVTYDKEFGNTIVSQWDLVCDQSYLADLSSSAFFLGYLIGSLLAPVASDHFGRRRPMLLSIVGLAIVGALLGASPSYWIFWTLRVLSGIFVAGTGVTGFVTATEIMEPSKRSWTSFVSGMCWATGYCLVGLVAWALPNWRMMALGIGLPSWIGITYFWLIPESLHWYVAKGKITEAKQWIAHAAKVNKVEIDWQECFSQNEPLHKPKKETVGHIIRSPILIIHTIVLAYLWFANSFIYYGLSLFTATLAGNRYVNYILSGLVEIPSHLAVTVLFNCIGRKKTMGLFHFLAALALVILPFLPQNQESSAVQACVWLFGKFCVGLTFPGIWLFSGEIFPTVVRSSGTGICSVAARVGGILAPFVGSLAKLGAAVPPMLFGGMSLLAALLVLLLPETNKKELPDEIDQIDPGPVWGLVCNKHE